MDLGLDLRDGKNTDFFSWNIWEDVQGPVPLRVTWARLLAVRYRARQ